MRLRSPIILSSATTASSLPQLQLEAVRVFLRDDAVLEALDREGDRWRRR